jgi:hypothetical protein
MTTHASALKSTNSRGSIDRVRQIEPEICANGKFEVNPMLGRILRISHQLEQMFARQREGDRQRHLVVAHRLIEFRPRIEASWLEPQAPMLKELLHMRSPTEFDQHCSLPQAQRGHPSRRLFRQLRCEIGKRLRMENGPVEASRIWPIPPHHLFQDVSPFLPPNTALVVDRNTPILASE